MKSTMYEISLAIATILDDDIDFKTYCLDILGSEFTYYVHVDMTSIDELKAPYFSLVTYTDSDKSGEVAEITSQFLVGNTRSETVLEGRFYTENTQHLLELVTKKAFDTIFREMTTFGFNGETGFIKDYLNIYAAPPMGEDDIQLQIDMILNTKTCLNRRQ